MTAATAVATAQEIVDAWIYGSPTGRILSEDEPGSLGWFAARRSGITATDIPRIIGESKYGNARSVWADKRGELPEDPAGEAGEWGNLLEPVIADRWAVLRGTSVFPVGVMCHEVESWQVASLDRVVDSCPDSDSGRDPVCGLEVKTRSAFTAGLWRDDLPSDVHAQVMWQMVVSGFRHMHVACLLGGQRMVDVRVDWDESIAEWLICEARRVWGHVLDGTPPQVRFDDVHLSQVLSRLFPDRSGDVTVPTDTADRLVAEWHAAQEQRRDARDLVKAADARLSAVKAEMVDLLGSAVSARVDGDDEPSWSWITRERAGHTVAPTTYKKMIVRN